MSHCLPTRLAGLKASSLSPGLPRQASIPPVNTLYQNYFFLILVSDLLKVKDQALSVYYQFLSGAPATGRHSLSRVRPWKLIERKNGKGAKLWDGDTPSVTTHAVWSVEAKSLSPLSIVGEQF